jgi:hypothetical protein
VLMVAAALAGLLVLLTGAYALRSRR